MENEVKQIIGDLSGVPMSELARCIGMHRAQFQFKLNESVVNGVRYKFTDTEIKRLSVALKDMQQRIKTAADGLNVEASDCIAFGNEVSDTQAAQNIGIKAYNCLWGATDDERKIMLHDMEDISLAQPTDILKTLFS